MRYRDSQNKIDKPIGRRALGSGSFTMHYNESMGSNKRGNGESRIIGDIITKKRFKKNGKTNEIFKIKKSILDCLEIVYYLGKEMNIRRILNRIFSTLKDEWPILPSRSDKYSQKSYSEQKI